MANPVIHFEIISADGDAARAFYGEVFGWAFNTDNPLQYGATDTRAGGEAIKGGVSGPYPGTTDTYATFYVSVTNVESTLQEIVQRGGQIAMPVIELPGGMKMAQFRDPFGVRVGLLQAPSAGG
ncbi:MAG: VOC family protein [Myxococcota bacterium]